MESRTIKGYRFKWDEDNKMFECRGSVCYDDEHDEIPEPSLWRAALKLAEELNERGINARANHSEKGWVEVEIR